MSSNNFLRLYKERATRFADMLTFNASTFGSSETSHLITINISYSGLLLASNMILPYQLKTILELSTKVTLKGKEHELQFLGKIVRLNKGNTEEIQRDPSFSEVDNKYVSVFGVSIIDINDNHLVLWKTYVDHIQNLLLKDVKP